MKAIYKALSTYPDWKLHTYLKEPAIIYWYLFAPLSDIELSEADLETVKEGVYIADGVRVDIDGDNIRVITDHGRIAMTNLVRVTGATYSYFTPPQPWIIDGKWDTQRTELCEALATFSDWELVVDPVFKGEEVAQVVLWADVEALREVLDETYVRELMDELYLAVGVRALHWGDLEAGRIRITAFKGMEVMKEFTERYNIAFKDVADEVQDKNKT